MTTLLPEQSGPPPVPAPIWSRTRVLIAVTGVAVLFIALLMAYRETRDTNTGTPGSAQGSHKSSFAFHPQPRDLPMFRFADEHDRAMTLQDFRGKFLLLNVWATWCVPCRKEMPTLDRLQQKLGGPDFAVIALSIDQGGADVVRSFYDDVAIQALRIYVDKTSAAMTDLGVAAIPATLLIDRQGREIGRKLGPAEWDSTEMITMIREQMNPPASDRQETQ